MRCAQGKGVSWGDESVQSSEAAARAWRFVTEEGDARNLDRLFSLLRFESQGFPIFRDIADFAAHSDLRDRGAVFEGAQEYSTIIEYAVPRIASARTGQSIPTDKAALAAFAKANLAVLPEAVVQEGLGIDKAAAANVLRKALSNLHSFDGRHLVTYPGMTNGHKAALEFFGMKMRLHGLFDDNALIEDVAGLLVREGLLVPKMEEPVRFQKAHVAQYAIEKMNKVQIKLPSGKNGLLKVSLMAGDKLGISATVPDVIEVGVSIISMSVPLFTTDNAAEEWLTPALHAALKAKYQIPYDIELRSDWKLDLLDPLQVPPAM